MHTVFDYEVPEQPERRLELARKTVAAATGTYGIAVEDGLLDGDPWGASWIAVPRSRPDPRAR
jgi:hypothetical protein